MSYTLKESALLREKCYEINHKSGLKVYLIPKDQTVLYSLFATRYGSMDNKFKTSKTGEFVEVPDGIAHFLEHKLFENENGEDTFLMFSKFGASCNAFTSNEVTAYLFSATENYSESLKVLLEFVTAPYFTEETVNKEMGIIEQELKMYEDNPNRFLYQELLRCLYNRNTVRIPVGGTCESIHKIDYKLLYDCYNTFYNLNNMFLIVCGNMTPEDVEKCLDEKLKKAEDITIEKFVPDEEEKVFLDHSEKKFPISKPLFCIGIKDNDVGGVGDEITKHTFENSIIDTLLFGKGYELYQSLYEKGIINEKFSVSSQVSKTYAYHIFFGETDNTEEVRREILSRINDVKSGRVKLLEEEFDRCKKALYSDTIQSWNSTTDIADEFLEYVLVDGDMMKAPEILASITFEDCMKRLQTSYDTKCVSEVLALPEK